MNERLDFEQLIQVVQKHCMNHARVDSADFEGQTLSVIFYDAILVTCNLDPRYGVFGIAVVISEGVLVREFNGEEFAQNNDEQSIRLSLDKIDRYCRLRLPDKYLSVFGS